MANSLFPLYFLIKEKGMEAPFIRIKAIALMVSSLTLTYLNFKQWSAYDNGLLHTTQELKFKIKYF